MAPGGCKETEELVYFQPTPQHSMSIPLASLRDLQEEVALWISVLAEISRANFFLVETTAIKTLVYTPMRDAESLNLLEAESGLYGNWRAKRQGTTLAFLMRRPRT
uniref:Uncharacterized protein n=1 Tax=Vespula pensylvanica TaxID=30213 RepID=A0A834K801_VESPE|nr:hypothetical protein H0235_015771 [Vespula pensylvanica]